MSKESIFKVGTVFRNRHLSAKLLEKGTTMGTWIVVLSAMHPGIKSRRSIMTEEQLLEMSADATIRNMTRVSDTPTITRTPKKVLSPILLAQMRLANRRAQLMAAAARATN